MRRQGFTLIELLVSLSLFSILLVAIFYSFSIELNFWKKVTASVEKSQISNMLLSRISRDIQRASGFATLSSDNFLSLACGSETVEYSFVYDKVKRKAGGLSAYLTMPGDIENLQFEYPGDKIVEIKIGSCRARAAMRN